MSESMASEDKDSTSRNRVRVHGGDSWSTGNSHGGAATKKKMFDAPFCDWGTYVILFESSTLANPNRLFFGCPHFKGKGSHCKYFWWLDEYVESFHCNDGTRSIVEMQGSMKMIEERMASIEKMMEDLNKGKRDIVVDKCNGIAMFFLGIVFAICFSVWFSSIVKE
ncbi:hypothetical protein PIB30_033743 [Stylosanthes scabra]|uniref:Zinc finger GRF-type domain-containing protein n=1 Tax=Stylosanthes scabra TaxID=79078 RepID=A0ABU6QCB7_9FABA|nr:hypothetical protein [Stylosanthes scabra]